MPDRFTESSHRSWGQNILQSIGGAFLGFILFIASFFVLWTNEGRADLSKIAERAEPVSQTTEGKLVYVSGQLNATAPIGDSEYLKPGPYIRLDREVEMFAWVETATEETKDKLGGGTDVVTTYDYKKEWTTSPPDATKFKYPDGHGNPALNIQDQTIYAATASVGSYTVDAKTMELPAAEPVTLNKDAIAPNNSVRQEGNYLYSGKGSSAMPEIGDVRISFNAVRAGQAVTAFGTQEGSSLVAHREGSTTLYRALTGSKSDAIATLKTEHKTIGWILRLVGFLMMWFGLMLCFAPLNTILKVVPFMGTIGKGLTGVAMFLVSLILSAVTILVAMIAHSVIALIVVLILVTGGIIFFVRKRKH